MRPVTLGSAPPPSGAFEQWVASSLQQIQQASNDTLTNDASSSGAALATCAGATADQIAYFTDDTHTAFTNLTAFSRTLLADADAAAWQATLGVAPSGSYLVSTNNLSDVASASTSRTNLGLGTAATHAATDFLLVSNNLSDVPTPATARTNIGAAGTTQIDFISGGIKIPANQYYFVVVYAPFGMTLTDFWAYNEAGTCTADLYISGTHVTSSTINVTTSSVQHVALSAANVVVAGNWIAILISSASGSTDLAFTVGFTRVLS